MEDPKKKIALTIHVAPHKAHSQHDSWTRYERPAERCNQCDEVVENGWKTSDVVVCDGCVQVQVTGLEQLKSVCSEVA